VSVETEEVLHPDASPDSTRYHEIPAQYHKTERGTLLPMLEYGTYHEARLKGASYVCQIPQLGSIPSAKRSVIESSEPVIAADADMKLTSTHAKAVVIGHEAANLKPQRRFWNHRVSSASNSFFRDTTPYVAPGGPYRHPNDRIVDRFEEAFGHNPFSIEDVISLQRSQKHPNDDPSQILPHLTAQDILNYESTMEGIREALESRWANFCEKSAGSQTPLRSPYYQLHRPETRQFLQRLVLNLQFGRKDDILQVAEELKPLLKEARRANPNLRPKSNDGRPSPSSSSDPLLAPFSAASPDSAPLVFQPNEDWPLVFEETSQTLPGHLQHLWKTELSRSVIMGLALFASSTQNHPIPATLSALLGNCLLQPLGYLPNPQSAQLLLTQLGMPIVDPLELPFLFNSSFDQDGTVSYPWLPKAHPPSLEEVAELSIKQSPSDTKPLSRFSPRQVSIEAIDDIPSSMSLHASNIFESALENQSSSFSEPVQHLLTSLVEASKSSTFNFSKNISSSSNPIELPPLMSDSSAMLSHMDMDRESRVDLSDMPSYAIDDKSTTEVDDAFALDVSALEPHYDWIVNHLLDYSHHVQRHPNHSLSTPLPTGIVSAPSNLPRSARVFIHIADPTAVMRVGDDLEMGARSRAETLYLPHRKSVMLPSILSEFLCSLQPHPHMNMALTYEVEVDLMTGAIEPSSMAVYPSKFRKMSRITYETSQAVLAGLNTAEEDSVAESDKRNLRLLWTIAKLRKRWRLEHGKAETMQLLRTDVKLTTKGGKPHIELYRESGNESSRSLVEEMMVMVGEITGRTAQENEIAVPFRTQARRSNLLLPPLIIDPSTNQVHNPHYPTAASILECDVSKQHLIANLHSLNYLNTSHTTSIPAPHQSLGLALYSRASSPLRRYADIISHFQLKAWRRFGGDRSRLEYSPAQVHALCKHIDAVSKDLKYAQQQSERWWKQQYVLRHGMDRTWDAIVFKAPDLHALSVGKPSSRALQYSFCILELDTIVFLPTPVHLEVGQLVKLLPIAASEIHLEWTVLPSSGFN
jgi:exoribonuclease R